MAAILAEMQTICCIEHDGHRKFITPFIGDQILICDAFGFEIPEGCRPTYTSKKSTKGKRGRPPKPQVDDYSGINVPLVAVCNVPPVAQCNVPPQKWLQ